VSKRIGAEEAARLVRSGDAVASVGVIGWVTPDALLRGVADRFRRDSEPRDLTFYFPCGTGDSIDIRGMDHVAIEGLMRRIISGSYVNPLHPTKRTRPELMRLIRENRVEAYSWPIGASMQWLREVARRSPGLMTEIGLGTYADPREQGGKFTSRAKQDLIELIEFRGKPYLFYPTFPLNVGFIRASSADSSGNLSYEDETLISSNVALALAVKASGGIVVAQVRQEVPRYSRPAHHVRIPGALVDHYVVEPEQMSGTDIRSDRAYLGGSAPDLRSLPKLPLGPDKVIARRASLEVQPGRTCIFGFGASSDVPLVMAEAGLFDDGHIGDYQFTTEHGPFGGIVMSGWQFSANIGPEALLDGVQQFDFIDGGNCPFAALAFAQFDREGNVNVSWFGSSNPGAGGFIDIAQNAKDLVFTGTFTTSGLNVSIGNGGLRVVKEGSVRKFVDRVEQITYPVRKGVVERGQTALIVTERGGEGD
jgi:propionate CoA-transferase